MLHKNKILNHLIRDPMVLIYNDIFEIQLVEATTKVPFPEHTKDGNIYIEVEPEAEYFISLRQIAVSSRPLKVSFKVDNKGLGARHRYYETSVGEPPKYRGIADTQPDGTILYRSLKFVKASSARRSNAANNNVRSSHSMGTVEIQIQSGEYERGRKRSYQAQETRSSKFGVAAVAGGPSSDLSKKKCIRSGAGRSTFLTKRGSHKMKWTRLSDPDRIKLNYCATPGLILAGILPRYESADKADPQEDRKPAPARVASSRTNGNSTVTVAGAPRLSDEVILMDVKQERATLIPKEIVNLCADPKLEIIDLCRDD